MQPRRGIYGDIEMKILRALRRAPWFKAHVQALAQEFERRASWGLRYRVVAANVWAGDRRAEAGVYRLEIYGVQVRPSVRGRPRQYTVSSRMGGVIVNRDLEMN